jgi:hypothetical protein
MKNGRCKFHGGLSTGPRTPEGLERSRRARWKHGVYSLQMKTLLATIAAVGVNCWRCSHESARLSCESRRSASDSREVPRLSPGALVVPSLRWGEPPHNPRIGSPATMMIGTLRM